MMKGVPFVLAALVSHGCMPADKPSATSLVKETTATMPTPSSDPFEGVFPPLWRVGDRWRATMSSEVNNKTGNPKRFFRNVVFDFRVEDVPEGDDGFFLVRIKSADISSVNWVGKYRKKPFSFVRLEDQSGRAVPWSDADNGESPFVGLTNEGFLKDFPIMPTVPRLGVTPFIFKKNVPIAQQVERTPDGLRFTLVEGHLTSVIEWKRGAPWWSSLEWTDPLRLGDPPYPSGVLLPSGT